MNNSHSTNRLYIYGRFFIFAACAIPAILVLIVIARYGYNMPFADDWSLVAILRKSYAHQDITLAELAGQFNEHRILFPRLAMLGLARLSSWNLKYEMYFSFLLSCVTFLILLLGAKRIFWQQGGSGFTFPVVCLAMSLVFFSLTQQENILWGWQIQIYMSILAVALGSYLLTGSNSISIFSFLAALACAVVATYSFANGIIFWVLGGTILAMSKQSQRLGYLAIWLISFILITYIYYHGYVHPPSSPQMNLFGNPKNFILYLLTFLGAPLVKARLAVMIPAYVGGVVALSGLGIVVILIIYYNLLLDKSFLFWHAILFYVLISTFVTTVGRSGSFINQALAPRYITISSLLWLWIIVVGVGVTVRAKIFSEIINISLCGAFILLLTYYDKVIFIDDRLINDCNMKARFALETTHYKSPYLQCTYPNGMRQVYPRLEPLKDSNEFLRTHKLSFYNQ